MEGINDTLYSYGLLYFQNDSYVTAKTYCHINHGKLAEPKNEEQNEMLSAFIKSEQQHYIAETWIGMATQQREF